MGEMRLPLRTSHRQRVIQKPVSFKPDLSQADIPNAWKPPPEPEVKERKFKPPSNNLIRTVASLAAKEVRYVRQIARFDKIVRTYCGVALKFFDHGYQVEEYVYQELREALDARKQNLYELYKQCSELRKSLAAFHGHAELRSNRARKIKRKIAAIEREVQQRDVHGDGVPIIGWRRWLEVQAERVFLDIADELLNFAQNGRMLRKARHADYVIVMGYIKNRPSQKIFLVVNPEDHGPVIMGLKTSREYRRNLRRHRRSTQEYRNRPDLQVRSKGLRYSQLN